MIRWRGCGPGAEREPVPGDRGRAGAVVILLLGIAALPFTTHPWYHPTADGSMYLVTARSMLDGQGYALNGELFRVRPPGFSALLVPLLAADAGFRAINLLVGFSAVLMAAAFYEVQRPRIGPVLAAMAAVFVWLLPKVRILANQVMSDVPGVALLLVALLVERRVSRRPSVAGEIVLGICLGLSAYVRAVVVFLLPALLLSRVLDRFLGGERHGGWMRFTARRLLPVTATVVVLQLPWTYTTRVGPDARPSDQAGLFSYSTGMRHRDGGDPWSPERPLLRSVKHRLPDRISKLTGAAGSGMLPAESTPRHATIALALLLSSLWVLAKRRSPADFYVFLSIGLLTVYFGYQPRLLLPVYVIAFPALLETVRDAVGRLLPGRAGTIAAAAVVVAWGAVTVKSPRAGWDPIRKAHERRQAVAAAISERIAPDATVGAFLGWNASVYLERPVITLRFHLARVGDIARATEEMIARYGIDVVVVRPDAPSNRSLRDHLLARHGKHAVTRAGPMELVAVRPRPEGH